MVDGASSPLPPTVRGLGGGPHQVRKRGGKKKGERGEGKEAV